MKSKVLIGIAIVTVLGLAFGFQTGQELFQQALSKERVEGNLQEAIALYQKVIDQGKDEALAAKAQLQIGFCYEKLGLKEAEKAFKLVIEKYPVQAEAVRQAKERLAEISGPASAGGVAPAPASGLTLRKLDIPMGIPSPDGNYIGSSEGEADLFLVEISTGKKQILKKCGEKYDFLFSSVLWAPDSKRFAYVWMTPKENQSLNIWNLADHSTKKAFEDPEIGFLNLVGWTPDQGNIFVQYRQKDRIRRLGRISLSDGALTEILAENNAGFNMALSPDGKYVAYNRNETDKDQDIRTVTADGKHQEILFKCQGKDYFLSWTPDGNHILFSGDRTGTICLWRQGVRDGKAEGEPKIITVLGGQIYSSGMTNDGAFYYELSKWAGDAFTAKIDLATGKTVQPLQKVETETVGRSSTPFWSDDGKTLAYFFRKNSEGNPTVYDTLKIHNRDSASTKELSIDFTIQPTYAPIPRWTRDGKSIHLRGTKSGKSGLIRFDIDSGQSEFIADVRGIIEWSRDGKTVFIIERGISGKLSENQRKLVRKDLETGVSRILYQGAVGELISWIKLSLDESSLGFISRKMGEIGSPDSGIRIIPSVSARTLSKDSVSFFFPTSDGVFFWAPEGKGLILRARLNQTGDESRPQNQFFYYPTPNPNQTPIKIDLDLQSDFNLAFHPDGQTIAYTRSSSYSEFWVMENFLPKK